MKRKEHENFHSSYVDESAISFIAAFFLRKFSFFCRVGLCQLTCGFKEVLFACSLSQSMTLSSTSSVKFSLLVSNDFFSRFSSLFLFFDRPRASTKMGRSRSINIQNAVGQNYSWFIFFSCRLLFAHRRCNHWISFVVHFCSQIKWLSTEWKSKRNRNDRQTRFERNIRMNICWPIHRFIYSTKWNDKSAARV